MTSASTKGAAITLVFIGAIALSGCAVSRMRLSDDYGQALRQDLVAQVADPDAHYKGLPAPGSDGHRVALAVERYNHNLVVQPTSTATSSVTVGGGAGSSGAPME